MPKRALPAIFLIVLLTLVSCGPPEPPPAQAENQAELDPDGVRLILVLVADQCVAEYLDRFAPLYHGGLEMLRRKGASFTAAHHFHSTTSTAVGHATLATGCFPGRHGIIANDWYEKDTGKLVYAVDDEEYDYSPRLMLCHALGDWLKAAGSNSKVFAASAKDRAAITMGGHHADGAFWNNRKTGRFRSSDYYYPDGEPAWVDEFNDQRFLHRHFGEAWEALPVGPEALEAAGISNTDFGPLHPGFPHVFGVPSPAPERWFFEGIVESPWGDELLARFGRRLIEAEELGMDGSPDLLFLSFSALDWVGHDYGPNSREVLDSMMRLDQYLSGLFDFIDETIGLEHTLITFTGDHGVAPVPEYRQEIGQPGSRLTAESVLCFQQAGRQLDLRFGDQDWFLPGPFLNPVAVERSGVPREELESAVAEILSDCPSVDRVWTRSDLLSGSFPDDPVFSLFRNNFSEARSPDFLFQFEEYHDLTRGAATTHGTPYPYDTHVPLILFGPGIPAGRVHERVNSVDLAPTLAALAGIPIPEEIDGRSLVPDLENVRVVLDEVELLALESVAAVETAGTAVEQGAP
jgi:predicted AlkP superfamily pyrophosphatase or phosphodiesterase